jgi:hypothetical protein
MRLSDNTKLQSGLIQVDQTGKVTVPELKLFKNPVRTRLIIEYADADQDGDGFTAMNDCNDSDASVYPGAPEQCDDKDNDCNGKVDDNIAYYTYYRDADGDGFGHPSDTLSTCIIIPPSGYVTGAIDCSDDDATVYPGATEVCDGKDNDCNGKTDDGLAVFTYYADADGDGYGNAGQRLDTCLANAPAAFVANDLDCDDNHAQVNPGQPELPGDGLDNDCDGIIDNTSSTKETILTFSIYPNPVHDWLTIESTEKRDVWYEISDLSGKIVRTGKALHSGGSLRISFESEPSGTYILQLRQGVDGIFQKIRVVKM